jgi:hypothetical protein
MNSNFHMNPNVDRGVVAYEIRFVTNSTPFFVCVSAVFVLWLT